MSTDEQQAERRIADAAKAFAESGAVDGYGYNGAIAGFEAGYRAAETAAEAQIARLEADVANAEADESDRFFRSLAGLTGSDREAAYGAVILAQREEVRALEERLAAVTATSGRTFDGYKTALDRALAAEAERDAARAALRQIVRLTREAQSRSESAPFTAAISAAIAALDGAPAAEAPPEHDHLWDEQLSYPRLWTCSCGTVRVEATYSVPAAAVLRSESTHEAGPAT